MVKFIFGMQINIGVFQKLLLSFWVCIVRQAQSIQNDKFAISLQYLKENVKDDVDFLPADKHERSLQIDTIILYVQPGIPTLSKITSWLFLCNIQERSENDEVDFLHAYKDGCFLQIYTKTLMGMVKYSQNCHNSKFAMAYWASPPFLLGMGGIEAQTKFSKRGEALDRTSTFRAGLVGKRGVTFFRGVAIFT